MKIDFQKKNSVLIVQLSGEIDHHAAEEARGKIEKEIERQNGRNLLFDFQEVGFMDSAGIGMLIGRYKHMLQLGGETAVCAANEKVHQIFQISGIFQIIPYFKSRKEALMNWKQEGF